MHTPEIQLEVLNLHFSEKLGSRKIAKKLGINRKSVIRIIRSRAIKTQRNSIKRKTLLDSFKPRIQELLNKNHDITCTAILQNIRTLGYNGGRTTLVNYISGIRVKPISREAFLSLKFSPGECAQVDWGEFGDVFGDGTKIHVFVMVLAFSRYMYIEFTRSERFEDFIRCHENAFKYFGGFVPKEAWYDNLLSAVTERMGSIIKFNTRFMAYMGHHGIRPHACNPARGNEKGRVEDGVKYVKNNFWQGKDFVDFNDIREQSFNWLNEIANKREHRSTRKIPELLYEKEEKQSMLSMNNNPYDTDEIFSRNVPPNFYITYETNKYSVPWTLVGNTVTIRVNATSLKIFYNDRFITTHERVYKKHQEITKNEHVAGLLDRKPGLRNSSWQVNAIRSIGPDMNRYIDFIKTGQRSMKNEFSKILALATAYGEYEVNIAAKELLDTGIIGVSNMELLLKQRFCSKQVQQPIEFRNQKLNRFIGEVDLRRYDEILFEHCGGEDDTGEL